jgi:hypothetical protein
MPAGPHPSNSDTGTKTAGGLNIIAGIWLIISGFILGYSNQPAPLWDDIILGIIVLVVAWARIANVGAMPSLAWINIIAGIWLFISPWVVRFSNQPTAMWNNIILGIIVFILAIWGLSTSPQRPAVG